MDNSTRQLGNEPVAHSHVDGWRSRTQYDVRRGVGEFSPFRHTGNATYVRHAAGAAGGAETIGPAKEEGDDMNTLTTRKARAPRIATKLLALIVAFGTVFGLATVTAAPASAWSWSSQVHLAGNAKCDRLLYSPKLVQVWPGNGEYGQAVPNWYGNYGMNFYRIGGPTTAWAKITCGYGNTSLTYSYWRSFTMYRPTVGSQLNVAFRG
jgi:hypothetical protein